MWSALCSIPEPQMAAGHKTLSVPPVRAVQLWSYILPTWLRQGRLVSKPISHRPADIHEISLWHFQRHFWEIFFWHFCFASLLFVLAQVGEQPALAPQSHRIKRSDLSRGISVCTHIEAYVHTLLTPKVNITYGWWPVWLPCLVCFLGTQTTILSLVTFTTTDVLWHHFA